MSFDERPREQQLEALAALAERAVARYRLTGARIELLQYEDNAVYAVTCSEARFVLRISAPDGCDAREQRSEMAWLTALRRDTGLRVPEPVADADGEWVTTVEAPELGVADARIAVLLRWVPGDPPPDAITPELAGRIGAVTGALHVHGQAFDATAEVARPSWDWARVFGTSAARDHEVLRAAATAAASDLDAWSRDPSSWGLIHADLHKGNLLVHDGEVGVIDFDDCGRGLLAYDLASLLDSLQRRMAAPGAYPELRAALLDGYSRVRALPHDLEPRLRTAKAMRDMVNVNFIVSSTNAEVRAWGAERLDALLVHLRGYVEGTAWIGI